MSLEGPPWRGLLGNNQNIRKNNFITFLKKSAFENDFGPQDVLEQKMLSLRQNCPKLLQIVKNVPKWPKLVPNWWSKLVQIVLNDQKDPNWSNIVQKGPIWSQMVPNCPKWSQMFTNSPKWSKMVQNGPKRSNMVQHGPKSPEVVQTRPKLSNISHLFSLHFQNCPKWSNIVTMIQNGRILSKMVQNGSILSKNAYFFVFSNASGKTRSPALAFAFCAIIRTPQ